MENGKWKTTTSLRAEQSGAKQSNPRRHCEERSDEAIYIFSGLLRPCGSRNGEKPLTKSTTKTNNQLNK